jgi:GT2 family glycosyltransferase
MAGRPDDYEPQHEPAGARRRGKLAVVIVTYNSASVLPALLGSLPDGLRGIADHELYVVDNDSSDGSAELAETHPIGAKVIRMGRNAGYAAGINAAAARAGPEADLLVLNPDLRLCPGAVSALAECLSAPFVGVAVPRNFRTDGSTDPTLRREPSLLSAWAEAVLGGRIAARLGLGEIIVDQQRYDRPCAVEWASGSALLIAAEVRRAAGCWDESFFLYSEEVDYQRKVREAGFGIVYEPRSCVVHACGESGSNPRLFALMTANRIRYYRRHHGLLATFLFRLAVILGETARSWRPVHRAGLRSALMPLRPSHGLLAETPR